MNRRQKIIVSITGIFIILLALVGLTYAYFLTRITGNENEKSISVTTANLELVYGDGNGNITATNILPGNEIAAKTFTVENKGNSNITYGVYLEDLVNTFELNEDVVYILTCETYNTNEFNLNADGTVTGKKIGDCNGMKQTTFPSTNAKLVNNNIEVGKTQFYKLDVDYLETNTNQSVDMNKTLEARVQIYALSDVVDVVVDLSNETIDDSYFAELHSTPAYGQIYEGKVKFVGVTPGNHTLYIKKTKTNTDGTITEETLGSATINITKGTTSSVNGTNIVINDSTGQINIPITNISNTLEIATITLGKEDFYNPYNDQNTLAYKILNDAMNRTESDMLKGLAMYSPNSLSNPGDSLPIREVKTAIGSNYDNYIGSEYTHEDYCSAELEEFLEPNFYISYSDSYKINEDGTFDLIQSDGSKVTTEKMSFTYKRSGLITDIESINNVSKYIGKYVVFGKTENEAKKITNLETIILLSELEPNNLYVAAVCSDYRDYVEPRLSITGKQFTLGEKNVTTEATLSITEDDSGDSYYYRGRVENNYVDFAGMCWRIVRIDGNGNTKLILEDKDQVCKVANGDFDIITGIQYGYDILEKESYENVITIKFENENTYTVYNQFKNFQTTLTTKINDLYGININKVLNPGNWCYDDSAYSDINGTQILLDKNSYYNNYTDFYYGAYTRIHNKNLTFKCSVDTLDNYDSGEPAYVATLTVDEMLLAGASSTNSNPTNQFYLLNDWKTEYSTHNWFSISPAYFGSFGWSDAKSADYVYLLLENGSIMVDDVYHDGIFHGHNSNSVRPAINLISGIKVNGGTGTKNDAYKISVK